ALDRLRSKRRITVTGATDSSALQNDERQARAARALQMLEARDAARRHLAELVQSSAAELQVPYPEDGSDSFIDMLLQMFERMLERQGNEFAEAVRSQAAVQLRHDVLARAQDEVTRHSRSLRSLQLPREPLIELATEVAT